MLWTQNPERFCNFCVWDRLIITTLIIAFFFISNFQMGLIAIHILQIFNGVFLKVNKATMNMLHRVEPYVTYGYPNLKSVRELYTREDMENSTNREFPWPKTPSSNRLLGSLELSALKILSMRSWLWDHTLRRQTTSYGLSSSRHHWAAWRRRGIIMLRVEMLATEKTTSMRWLGGWTKLHLEVLVFLIGSQNFKLKWFLQ